MKTLLAVAFVVLFGWIVLHRERVYVRDPLATVYRNDAKLSGVEVYINYSNDVLLAQDEAPAFRTIVQHWSGMPGTPVRLTCLHWMACLTDADHAPVLPAGWLGKGTYAPDVAMSSRQVTYLAEDGGRMRVVLR